ncbi:amidohydrolase [Acetobacteraceae bacterium H6797]|nr:amidohydrolase [Acetobacteraceae bacterium H6797]
MDQDLSATLTQWRRHLHANPDLTLHEERTAGFVAARLRELGVDDIVEKVGGHGVVATIRKGGGNRSVGLRADMDALPIQETNLSLPYASTNPGVMHACGHDGHTAALLGAAALLVRDDSWSGTVRLVFQPAEEGGGGAKRMIADGLFKRFPMDRIFGWHNWPGLEAGTIAVHDSAVMAAGARFEVTFTGHAGHAALPHLTKDPIVAAGQFIVAAQSVVARSLDPLDTGVVSLTMVNGGEAQNQIASRVVIKGTARFLKMETGDAIEATLRRIVQGIGTSFDIEAELDWGLGVAVTANHPAERDLAAAASAKVTKVRRDMLPAMTSEDFSWFLHEVPGAFVWIGNGSAEGGRELHNPNYNFNDEILPVAAGYLAETAKASLSSD